MPAAACLGQRPQVARVAHEEEGGNIAQRIRQPAQSRARPTGRFGALVAGRTQRDQILQRVGLPIVPVDAREVAELAKGLQMMDVMRPAVAFRRATLAAAESITFSSGLADARPVRSIVVGRQQDALRLEAFHHLRQQPQPASGRLKGTRGEVDLAVPEGFVRVALDLAVGGRLGGQAHAPVGPAGGVALVGVLDLEHLQVDRFRGLGVVVDIARLRRRPGLPPSPGGARGRSVLRACRPLPRGPARARSHDRLRRRPPGARRRPVE